MEREYVQVSNDVVTSKDEYFARVISAESLKRKFFDEESVYGISSRDIVIRLMKENYITQGILVTLSRENEECDTEESPETSFIDIIISDAIGTFISDWY